MTVCVSEPTGVSKLRRGSGYLRQAAVIALINIPVMSFGLALGWVSIATGETGDESPTPAVVGAAAVTFAGGLLGVPVSAKAITYGRKPALMGTSALFALCWSLKLIGGTAWWWLLSARTIAGLAGEGAWCIAPILGTEMVSPKLRGAAGAAPVLAHNLGSLLAYLSADIGLNHTTLLWCCLGVSVVHLLMYTVVPESPAYLAAHSKPKEARKSLAWLRSVPKDDATLDTEILSLPPPDGPPVSPFAIFKELWTCCARRKAFFIAVGVVVGQEVCGLFALMQYAERFFVIVRDSTLNSDIFTTNSSTAINVFNVSSETNAVNMSSVSTVANLSNVFVTSSLFSASDMTNATALNVSNVFSAPNASSTLANVLNSHIPVDISIGIEEQLTFAALSPARHALILGGVQFVAAAAALYLVEKVGRRRLLIFSSLCVSVCVCVCGAAVWVRSSRAAAVAAAFAIFADSIGVEPVAYAMLPELFHYRFRSLVVTISMALVDIAHAIEMLAFPSLVSLIGLAPSLLGAGVLTLLYSGAVAATAPETRELTPDQIYDKLHKCNSEKCCADKSMCYANTCPI